MLWKVGEDKKKWIDFAKATLAIWAPEDTYANGGNTEVSLHIRFPGVVVDSALIPVLLSLVNSGY